MRNLRQSAAVLVCIHGTLVGKHKIWGAGKR